jgi:hypothetical protein
MIFSFSGGDSQAHLDDAINNAYETFLIAYIKPIFLLTRPLSLTEICFYLHNAGIFTCLCANSVIGVAWIWPINI